MHHKHDKAAQSEWLNNWEDQRANEADDYVIVLALVCVVFGFWILNHIADWVVGI